MFKFSAISWLVIASLTAADSADLATTNEVAAMRTLRNQLFPAEVQGQGGGYQDFNKNGVGEYLFLAQLAGRTITNKAPFSTEGGNDTGIHLVTGPLATGLVDQGYRFAAILPGGDQGLIVETDQTPIVTLTGVADREKHFAILAWPTAPDQGRRSFLLLPDGVVRSALYEGKAPDAAKAIAYDPVKSTWTSAWEATDPRTIFERAKADIAKADYTHALERMEWCWDYSASIDPSLFGVRGSYMRTVYADLAKVDGAAMASYLKRKQHALEHALEDRSDPTAGAGGSVPENHLAFLDYLSLAEPLETAKEIVKNFKALDAVNPKLAAWEYGPVSSYLVQESEFAYMNKFVPSWMESEHLIVTAMLDDYKMDRMGVVPKNMSMSFLLSKLTVISLVYEMNKRETDALMMDLFVKRNLTGDEQKQLTKRISDAKAPRF